MPIFDYKCENCGHIFEIFFMPGSKEETDTSCPKCNNIKTIKLMGKAYPIFKGKGFYETDYKRKNENK